MLTLLILIPYAIGVTIALGLVFAGAKYLRHSEAAAYRRQIEGLTHTCDRLHVQCDDTLKDSRALAEQREVQHVAEIERMNALHAASLERLMNMVQFGTATPKEAIVTAQPDDADQRVTRMISDDMVEVGALRLQAMYEERGTVVSMDELREEARAMITGVGFTPSPDRVLMVKDAPGGS